MSAEGFMEFAETSYNTIYTLEEAEHTRKAFFERWPELPVWHTLTKEFARTFGYVVSPLGRIRRVPDILSRYSKDRSHAESQAVNSPVQGFGSDLMMIALTSIHERMPHVRVVCTVHDSVEIEIPVPTWQQDRDRIISLMEGVDLSRFGVNLKVPLVADAKCGSRWSYDDYQQPTKYGKEEKWWTKKP